MRSITSRDLWEARGNVVVEKSDGKKLYMQQLFWNQQTKKIYSNVDSKIVQNDGRDVFIGEGFESDEEFKDWRFRRMKGRMEVEVKPNESDSTAVPEPAGRTSDSPRSATDRPAAPVAAQPAAPLSEEPPLAAPAVRPDGEEELRPAEPVGEIQPLRRAVHADEAGKPKINRTMLTSVILIILMLLLSAFFRAWRSLLRARTA